MTSCRETGNIRFPTDVYAMAQNYASVYSAFLHKRNIGVAVTGITVDPARQMMYVTGPVDLSSLIPGILPFQEVYRITGTTEARIDGR